ncbi:MAG: KTSC domain-containing protein [Thermoplasmata archaeon]
MIRKPVESSNLISVGYDSKSATLEIEFRSGDVYRYFDVAESLYVKLMEAPSHGKFFHAHIRDKYRYAKVG